MPNCPLTLRTIKGGKLTFTELDNNFLSLDGCIDSLQSNIYGNFLQLTGGTLTGPLTACTGIYTDELHSCSNMLTVFSDITINGDVVINGSATTINTQVIQSLDNSITLNYSGTHLTAIGGGIIVEDGQSDGVDSSILTDTNGNWVFTPGITSSTLSACTGIWTSNLYGCSPITIHDNLILESGVTITTSNGGGQIELDYALQPSNILISTDNGGSSESFVNLQPTELSLSSLNGDVRIQSSNSNSFRSGNLFSNRSQILMEPDFVKIGVVDPSAVFSNDYESVVVYNTRSSDQATSNANKWPVTVSSKNSTILSGVRNSVILGGSDITATTNNTVYVDNLNIKTIGGGTSVINLGLDVNGNVVTGVTSNSGIFGISNSGGAYTYYSTLSSAMSAATAGQTIEMFADVNETGNVTISWKNGVNFNGNNHTYTHSYSSGDSNTINLPTAITANISNWRVIRTGRTNGTSTDYVFTMTDTGFGNNASTIIFNNVYMESTYGTAVYISMGGGLYQGSLYGKGYLYGVFAHSEIRGVTGESTVASPGIYLGNNQSAYNCIGISVSGYGIHINGGVRIVQCLARSTSNTAIYGGTHINCVGISVSSAGGVGNGYNSTYISTSGIAGDGIQGSNNVLVSSSNYGWYTFFAGYKITNSLITSTSNLAAYTRGATIKNCVIRSDYNNAAGHAISEWLNDSVSKIISCDLEVTNASANCINSSAGALNIKIANCTYDGATTPVGSNITQTLSNTQDNQGNIVL